MKRITTLFILILSLTLVILLPVHAAEFDLVADGAGLLSDSEYIELNELALAITEQYQCEMSIVIIEDKGDDDVTEFANYVYEENDYGYGTDKSGLMLLISMKDRDYALIAHGAANTAFTDHGKDVLLDSYLLPLLGKDQYYAGFLSYLNQTSEFLKMAENGTPFDVEIDEASTEGNANSTFWTKLAITILVPLFIAGLVCLIFLGKMKTAVSQRTADNYIPDGGVHLTKQVDKFLSKSETRTRIEKKSSNGGTSIGSNGSSSKSGKF